MKYATFVEIIIQRFGQSVNNVYLCIKKCVYGHRLSWQQGTAEADKTAFLASSTIPPEMVLKCYDWATAKHEGCVVSGFSSKLEQDVLHFLLKAKCPIILLDQGTVL